MWSFFNHTHLLQLWVRCPHLLAGFESLFHTTCSQCIFALFQTSFVFRLHPLRLGWTTHAFARAQREKERTPQTSWHVNCHCFIYLLILSGVRKESRKPSAERNHYLASNWKQIQPKEETWRTQISNCGIISNPTKLAVQDPRSTMLCSVKYKPSQAKPSGELFSSMTFHTEQCPHFCEQP